jgi:hypothetical protein
LGLADGKPLIGVLAGDFGFDIVERTNAVERFAGDGRFGAGPQIVEIPAQMRPARCFAQMETAVGPGLICTSLD